MGTPYRGQRKGVMFDKIKDLEYLVGFGVFGGMLLQYIYGGARGWRVVGLIVLTTTFLAFAILIPVMDGLNEAHWSPIKNNISPDSPFRVFVLSLTALASEALVKLLIIKVPARIGQLITGISKEDLTGGGKK